MSSWLCNSWRLFRNTNYLGVYNSNYSDPKDFYTNTVAITILIKIIIKLINNNMTIMIVLEISSRKRITNNWRKLYNNWLECRNIVGQFCWNNILVRITYSNCCKRPLKDNWLYRTCGKIIIKLIIKIITKLITILTIISTIREIINIYTISIEIIF